MHSIYLCRPEQYQVLKAELGLLGVLQLNGRTYQVGLDVVAGKCKVTIMDLTNYPGNYQIVPSPKAAAIVAEILRLGMT